MRSWDALGQLQPQEVSVALWKWQRKVRVALEENLTQEGGEFLSGTRGSWTRQQSAGGGCDAGRSRDVSQVGKGKGKRRAEWILGMDKGKKESRVDFGEGKWKRKEVWILGMEKGQRRVVWILGMENGKKRTVLGKENGKMREVWIFGKGDGKRRAVWILGMDKGQKEHGVDLGDAKWQKRAVWIPPLGELGANTRFL